MYRRRSPQQQYGGSGRRRGLNKGTLLIAAVIVAFTVVKYCSQSQENPLTGETQYVSLTPQQEIALGLQSAPQMIQQHGGLHPDQQAQAFVDMVGNRLIENSVIKSSEYQFDFHLLADPRSINAFALPGGQVFITAALFDQLQNEDQLAGVIGHEIAHVIERHSAERISKQELTQGLTGAAVIAAGDYSTAQAAQMISNVINMSYGRDQELESDDWGVRIMLEAGYDPEEMITVMEILKKSAGPNRQPEFMSTHPDPENRAGKIREAIKKYRGY